MFRTLSGLENPQGWRLHNLSEQSVPLLYFPHGEKVSPYIQSKPLFPFMPVLLCSRHALLGIACSVVLIAFLQVWRVLLDPSRGLPVPRLVSSASPYSASGPVPHP